jgi:molybdate transport system substrate-binding protein
MEGVTAVRFDGGVFFGAIFWAIFCLAPRPVCALPGLRVAAASDLRAVLPEVVEAFKAEHPGEVRVTYGSSGKLATQIVHGAPFDVFLSADTAPVDMVLGQGFARRNTRVSYATGVLMLWTQRWPGAEKRDWREVLRQAAGARVAIAHPEHAPYGRAAFEALRQANLAPPLLRAENVALAAQMAVSGQVPFALTARSLLRSPPLKRGRYWELPPGCHAPLLQEAVILTRARGETSQQFLQFLQATKAQSLFFSAGFRPPQTSSAF